MRPFLPLLLGLLISAGCGASQPRPSEEIHAVRPNTDAAPDATLPEIARLAGDVAIDDATLGAVRWRLRDTGLEVARVDARTFALRGETTVPHERLVDSLRPRWVTFHPVVPVTGAIEGLQDAPNRAPLERALVGPCRAEPPRDDRDCPLIPAPDPGQAGVCLYRCLQPAALDAAEVARAEISLDPISNQPRVDLEFTTTGAAAFASLTAASIDREVVIAVDGEILLAPRVVEPVTGGRVAISLGASRSLDEQSAEAEALLRALSPEGRYHTAFELVRLGPVEEAGRDR